MEPKMFVWLGILLLAAAVSAEEAAGEGHSAKENDLYATVEEELSDELKKEIKIEHLNKVEDCKRKAKAQDFLSLNFTSKWADNGEVILSTAVRNVPIEIQLGSKMLSAGVDYALEGICIGERRRVTLPARLGLSSGIEYDEKKKNDLVTVELELISLSEKMTLATFHYLDLNGDGKVSVKEAENLIKMFLSSLTSILPNIDLNQLLSFFLAMHDSNGDGQIDISEFLKSISSLSVRDEL